MASSTPFTRYNRRRVTPAIILLLGVSILPGAAPLVTPKFAVCHQRHMYHQRSCRPATSTPATHTCRIPTARLHLGSPVVSEDIAVDSASDESTMHVDEFQPQTKTIVASVVFFTRYLVRTVQQERLTSRLTNRSKRRLLTKLRNSLRRRGWTADAETRRTEDEATLARLKSELGIKENEKELLNEENKGLRETLAGLNESRKALIKLVGYDSSLLVPSFGFLLLGALMTSIIPHYYSQCVTCLAAAESTSRETVVKSLFGLAVANVLAAVFTGMRGAHFWIAGSRGNYNVRVKLHRNLLLQEAAFFDSTETGTLLSRLNNDVNKIGMVISFQINVLLRQFAQFVFGAVYLVRISRNLSLYAFGGIGLVAIVSALYGRFARGLSERVQDTFARASAVAETSFSMSETVRAFDGIPCEVAKYEDAASMALELEETQAWAYGVHKFVSDTIEALLQCGLLFACWKAGRSGGLPVAQLTTFMFYVNFVLESSNEVGDQWAKIQSAIGASSNVFDLIRRVPAIRDPVKKDAVEVRSSSSSDTPVVSTENLSVTYGQMDAPALDGISLYVLPGDRVAIVGRSGSGKSSLLRTALRFYDPSSGSISFDGTNMKKMSRKEIAKQISVVEQEPHLFPMSLMDNVLYGIEMDSFDQETGEMCYGSEWGEAVANALEIAGLPVTGESNDLGLYLDSMVGEGYRSLSGGQRQRVAIARALIRQPSLLLLDEPTAALDSKSERIVVEALLNALKKTKSMLMVTHRLGVIRSLSVNKVIVLERGKVAEMGHPEDLLRTGGIYFQLAQEQGITALDEKEFAR